MTQPAPIPFPPLTMPDALDTLDPVTERTDATSSAPGSAVKQASVPAKPVRAKRVVSRLPLRVPVWPPGVD